jgi:sigma-B regulation protein RsbU (phosphoserine phosphatase)
MARERPEMQPAGRRRRPAEALPFGPAPVADTAARQSVRDLLLRTWPGRLFVVSAALKLVASLVRLRFDIPLLAAVSTAASIGVAVSAGYFAWRLFVQIKRRLLWRVRRKLILSYIFVGVVPSLLILVFFLVAGNIVFINVSAYLFQDAYQQVIDDARVSAQAAAMEIARDPQTVKETVARVHRIRSRDYPTLSVAFVSPAGERTTAGPWKRMQAPTAIPGWIRDATFAGTFGVPADVPGEEDLVVRAIAKVGTGGGAVVVDIPVDEQVLQRLRAQTGVKLENVFDGGIRRPSTIRDTAQTNGQGGGGALLFAQIDVRSWTLPSTRRDTLVLEYRLREMYDQLSNAQAIVMGGMNASIRFSDALLYILVLIAILFLIIEAIALVMGLALARSITSSVHELFMGTERVRQGDFTHRINIESKDQLGELADSFNQMTGSIENLLQTAAEKKRLEEELRIARQIQMSLLPRGPLDLPGLGVTALCVPAREVGGDYYDFFAVGERRLGVLIADVSGKGTSAALYMAELKGLMLSLSQIYQSPRQLLIEVNRIISENLDTRSFITMTYAVIDLDAGVMTFARAGHTPLIYVPAAADAARVLVPNGLVVGLRIPGAHDKFIELLEEDRIELSKGDVLVFYTDGISEAMNRDGDLFGDARLGCLLAEHGHLDAADLRERILREIEAFVGVADQHDDMTMILIKVEEAFAAPARVAV